MKFRNQFMKYMDKAGDDDAGAGGGTATDEAKAEAGKAAAADEAKAAADKAAAEKGDADKAKAEADSAEVQKLKDDNAKLLKESMKRKDSIQKLQATVDKFSGIDIDEVNTLLQEKKESETRKLEGKGEWDTLKQQMTEAHDKVIEGYVFKIADLESQVASVNGVVGDLTVGNSFGNSKFIANEMLLPPSKARVLYGDHFETENGKVVGYDAPRGAKTRTQLIGGDGEPLPFEDAITKIVKSDPDYENLIKSAAKPGSNSSDAKDIPKVDAAAQPKGRARIAASLSGDGK